MSESPPALGHSGSARIAAQNTFTTFHVTNENTHTPQAKADLSAQGYPLTFRRGKAGHTQRSASSTRPLRHRHSAIRPNPKRNPESKSTMKTAKLCIYENGSIVFQRKTTNKAGIRFMRRLSRKGIAARLWTDRGPFDGYRNISIGTQNNNCGFDNSIVIK